MSEENRILVPKSATQRQVKEAYAKIMALFEQYRLTENQTCIEQIQEIVEEVDVPFALKYQVEGERHLRNQIFVPKRLKHLSKRELMLKLDLK